MLMTIVNIFLASSLEDLKDDREALGNYIRKLNDIYMERDVYFRLFECEQESIALSGLPRKQEEYNRQIEASQLFFVIFFNKAGQYTLEEFEVAYKHFKGYGAPAIVTCFKQGDGCTPDRSVLDFMEHLDKELGHYFKIYRHIDSLKLSLLMQIKLMDLDIPVEMKDSRVTVGGQQVLTLDNIPMLANNADLQRLKAEYRACHEAYLDAKARAADPILDENFLAASEKWNKARKALQALEKDLLAMVLKMEEDGPRGRLTARQRRAYALMEAGDVDGANRVLDLQEILADAEHNKSVADMGREALAQNVQELLQKVDVLTAQAANPHRFAQIRRVYEEAVALEEGYSLPKKAMRKYLSFLDDQNDYKQAIPMAERYAKKHIQWEGTEAEIADAANILGNLYHSTQRFPQAEAEYLRAKEIREKLAADNPEAFLPYLAMSCNNLGNLYYSTQRFPQAEAEYLRAKEIREKLAAANPEAFLPDLATSCYNLGILYSDTQRFPQAEAEYLRAKEIREKLAAATPEAFLPDLASSCNNLGILYSDTQRFPQAEAEHLRAKEIREKLAATKPEAFLPDLAMSCNNLGNLYYSTQRFPQAEAEYLRAKESYKKLAAANPEAFLPDLAGSCNNLGILYKNTQRFSQAEAEYLRAIEIRTALAAQYPRVYLGQLAKTLWNFALLSYQAGNSKAAGEQFRLAAEKYEEAAKYNPSYANDAAEARALAERLSQ